MKYVASVILAFIMFFLLTSHNVVKHKKYNYYILDKNSFEFKLITFENMDSISNDSKLIDQKIILQDPDKIYVSIVSWGKALLDNSLDKPPTVWKHMESVYPVDTITQMSLIFYTKKGRDIKNIPFNFISSIGFNYTHFTIHYHNHTSRYNIVYKPSIDGLDQYKILYNNRDSVMSYPIMRGQDLLVELNLKSIDFNRLKKDKLIAHLNIKFSNGRELSVKKSILFH